MKPALALLRPAAALFLWAAPCGAHDFWIELSNPNPAPNSPVSVRLRVGMGFKGDPVPRLQAICKRLTLIDATGERAIIGAEGMDPAGYFRPGAAGLSTVVYESLPSEVELDGPKFEAYLKDEGLEAISRLRARRGETSKPAKDAFIRCAKALVDTGGGGGPGFNRIAGLPFELVPDRDPCALSSGGRLPVHLLYGGKPLPGALVVALNQADPSRSVQARTDARGRVTLELPRGGSWLIKAVHMIQAPAGLRADWESYWASLTFTTR